MTDWKQIKWNDIMNLSGLKYYKPSPLKFTFTINDNNTIVKKGIICIFTISPHQDEIEFLNVDLITQYEDSWIMYVHYFERNNMNGIWKLDAPCRELFNMDFDKKNDLNFNISYYYLRHSYKHDFICGPLDFLNLRKPNLL